MDRQQPGLAARGVQLGRAGEGAGVDGAVVWYKRCRGEGVMGGNLKRKSSALERPNT